MANIVKDRALITDDWRHLDDDTPAEGTRYTLSLPRWIAQGARLQSGGATIGVRLPADADPAEVVADLPVLSMVVLEFETFTDGRSFSLARLLRDRYGYTGEIRARGNFLVDQVYYLARVGVNAFEPAGNLDPRRVLQALDTFSVRYQASSDESRPLYRRVQRD